MFLQGSGDAAEKVSPVYACIFVQVFQVCQVVRSVPFQGDLEVHSEDAMTWLECRDVSVVSNAQQVLSSAPALTLVNINVRPI